MSHLFLSCSLDTDAHSFEHVSGFRFINTMPGHYTESGT
jgi:hypothetical protein